MQKINFQNLPNTATPVNASNLNQLQTNVENAIDGNFDSGSFTPIIYGDTTAGTASYILQEGHYQRVGKIVHFEIRIGCTLTGSDGLIFIGGLPNLGGYYEPSVMNVVSTLAATVGQPLCTRIYGNNLLLGTYEIGNVQNLNWSNTNYIYVSGTMLLM